MSWITAVHEIEHRTRNHNMLLSDALIQSIHVLGARVPQSVCDWLNREIVGYDATDLNNFVHLKFDKELHNRLVVGTWMEKVGEEAMVVADKKKPRDLEPYLYAGVQEIEVCFANAFDISVLCSSNEKIIDDTITQSGFREKLFYFVDQRFPQGVFEFKGEELIKIYRRVQLSLAELLALTPKSFTGKAMLIP